MHVYLVAPTGRLVNSMHVADAAKTKTLVALLEETVKQLNTPAGQPVGPPAPQSAAPTAGADDLVLHLVSRGHRRGSWREFPGENWIVLARSAWTKFLPPAQARVGQTWAIDRDAAALVLTHFYPQTENNDVSTNRIDHLTLTAKVISADNGVVRVRLDGRLTMKHPFYPRRDDSNLVEATVVGVLDVDANTRQVRVFRLVTAKAAYGREGFDVAVRSVP